MSAPKASNDSTQNHLESARKRISSVDKELMQLLKRRMDAVQVVAQHKRGDKDAILHDAERESRVAQEWEVEARELGLSAYHAGRILREVLNYSRRSQEPLLTDKVGPASFKVGYQGVAASYSELAIGKLFDHRASAVVDRVSYTSFIEVFDALETRKIDYALVPIENTLIGSIGEVNHLLATRNFAVVDEEVWEIEHCLAALPGASVAALRTVRSHPVALQQCQRLLGSLGQVSVRQHFDTAGAAQSVRDAGDLTIGCICSVEATRRFGLEVLRSNVSDLPKNQTRFLLLAREQEAVSHKLSVKTTIHFSMSDRCGALAEGLTAFARNDVNLLRLESRPQPEAPWEYLFLADLMGHQDSDPVRSALSELREHTNHLRILGTYPSRSVERKVVPSKLFLPRQHRVGRAEPYIAEQKQSLHGSFRVNGIPIGGDQFTLILGPCAVESQSQIMDAAAMAKAHGAHLMRGGAFKPRSSPHSFQGLGFQGLDLLVQAGQEFEMPVVTEVLQPEDVEAIAGKADVLQVGARNMQNYALLKKLGTTRRPILLKRGLGATLKELLQAADYIKAGGNQRIILCERGIRTFETSTRSTLDISAIPVLKSMTNLPVIVDPSHAAGVRHLVIPLALAAAAAGADGLMVECHPRPEEALCDKDQALRAEDLDLMLKGLLPILASQGRSL